MSKLSIAGACFVLISALGIQACSFSVAHNNKKSDSPDAFIHPEQRSPDLVVEHAVADAEMAIQKLDYRLLAFTNKTVSFPGVDMQQHSASWIEEKCGVAFLKGAGDTVQIGEDLAKRKALREYAIVYNQRLLRACLIFQKDYQ